MKCRFVHGAAVVIIVMAAAQLLLKAFQLFSLSFIRYFKDLSSFFGPVLYIGAIIFSSTFYTQCLCIPYWQWQVGVVTIFTGWVSLLFYLRRLPILGIYIVMFFNICKNSLKVLGVLIVLVVGFGLSLHMLFYNDQQKGVSGCGRLRRRSRGSRLAQRLPYPSPYRSMSTVLSHLQSEFGYIGLFKEDGTHTDDIQYKFMTFVVWAFMLICISILMANLMVISSCDCHALAFYHPCTYTTHTGWCCCGGYQGSSTSCSPSKTGTQG